MTESARPQHPSELRDPLYLSARGLFYLGLATSSLLVVRVGGGVTIGDLLLIAALILFAVSRLVNTSVHWPPSYFPRGGSVALFVIFVIAASLASATALVPDESLLVAARIALVAFAVPWLACGLLPTADHLARAAGWLLAGTAISSAGTLVQYFVGPDAIPGADVTNAGRFSGFTGHVSDMGGIAALGVALGVGFIVRGHSKRARFWGVVATALAAVGLILSGSVSGMLAVAVALLVYLGRRVIRIREAILVAVAGYAALWIGSWIQAGAAALSPIDRLLQAIGVTGGGAYATTDIRASTYEVALRAIVQNPFTGYGLDPASSIVDGLYPAHNLLIAALYQGGILLFAVMLVLLVRPFLGRWLRADRSALATQILAAGLSAIVFAMTAPSLFNRYLWLPVALLCVARVLALSRPVVQPLTTRPLSKV